MIKTIFDIMNGEKKENPIKFTDFLNNEDIWERANSDSSHFDNVILIHESEKYLYYITYKDAITFTLKNVSIYRERK